MSKFLFFVFRKKKADDSFDFGFFDRLNDAEKFLNKTRKKLESSK